MGHRSPRGPNKFELYKRGLGMASSIKSQPNSDDLEDFVLTKAEKEHHLVLLATTRYAPG